MPCISLAYGAIGPVGTIAVARPAILIVPAIPGIIPPVAAAAAPAAPLQPAAVAPGVAPPPGPQVPVTCRALYDTGASHTAVTAQIAQAANLHHLGMMPFNSAAGSSLTNIYMADVSVHFAPGHPPIYFAPNLLVSEFNNGGNPYDALLGRDIICKGIMNIGFDGRFTFSI
jgi:hypothetical protein